MSVYLCILLFAKVVNVYTGVYCIFCRLDLLSYVCSHVCERMCLSFCECMY